MTLSKVNLIIQDFIFSIKSKMSEDSWSHPLYVYSFNKTGQRSDPPPPSQKKRPNVLHKLCMSLTFLRNNNIKHAHSSRVQTKSKYFRSSVDNSFLLCNTNKMRKRLLTMCLIYVFIYVTATQKVPYQRNSAPTHTLKGVLYG